MDEIEQTQEPILTDEIITTDYSNQELKDTILKLTEKIYEECEWCYQFDEDEAQVFAWTNENDESEEEPSVTFTLNNNNNSYLTFMYKDKVFKLFARELTDAGKNLRDKSNTEIDTENINEK
jgi:hypothetical protein